MASYPEDSSPSSTTRGSRSSRKEKVQLSWSNAPTLGRKVRKGGRSAPPKKSTSQSSLMENGVSEVSSQGSQSAHPASQSDTKHDRQVCVYIFT
jgi:hypothetical protein